jgi:hypothetical protein
MLAQRATITRLHVDARLPVDVVAALLAPAGAPTPNPTGGPPCVRVHASVTGIDITMRRWPSGPRRALVPLATPAQTPTTPMPMPMPMPMPVQVQLPAPAPEATAGPAAAKMAALWSAVAVAVAIEAHASRVVLEAAPPTAMTLDDRTPGLDVRWPHPHDPLTHTETHTQTYTHRHTYRHRNRHKHPPYTCMFVGRVDTRMLTGCLCDDSRRCSCCRCRRTGIPTWTARASRAAT